MATSDKQVGFKLDDDTKQKVDTLAKEDRRTLSAYLRELIHRAWAEREKLRRLQGGTQ